MPAKASACAAMGSTPSIVNSALRRAAAALAASGTVAACAAGIATASPTQVAAPGSTIRMALIEPGCTIGIGGRDRSGAAIVTTAAHCSQQKIGIPVFLGDSNTPRGRLVALSPLTQLDYAAVRLNRGVSAPISRISGPGNVGDRVCKRGRMTGVTCGRIAAITDTDIVVDGVWMVWGDSGAGLENSAGQTIGTTTGANRASLPTDLLQAQAAFLSSMAGLSTPVPAEFRRADKIVGELERSIGFRDH